MVVDHCPVLFARSRQQRRPQDDGVGLWPEAQSENDQAGKFSLDTNNRIPALVLRVGLALALALSGVAPLAIACWHNVIFAVPMLKRLPLEGRCRKSRWLRGGSFEHGRK
jgi:hypothetical protein